MPTIRIGDDTFARLQAHTFGFRGDPLGTPDKVIAALLDRIDQAKEDAAALDALAAPLRAANWGSAADYMAGAATTIARTGRDLTTDPDELDESAWRRASMPRRDATQAELLGEPDGVLESMANGDLAVTETTRHLAQAELDHRRSRR